MKRARDLLASPGNAQNGYMLGTGGYNPRGTVDVPWTQRTDSSGLVHVGCDCAGLICWAYCLPRHRPGYNLGPWATISDDLNTNSWLEDADHRQDLFRHVAAPEIGDVVCYPTIHLAGHEFIGHCALVVGTDRAGDWDTSAPQFHLLDVIQVKGSNGRKPAAVATDGSVFDQHSANWPKPEHRSWLLRAIP